MAKGFWQLLSSILIMNKAKLIKEAKRIEEDALYSAKGHFNNSSSWTTVHYWLGVPSAVASALSGTSALAKFPYHEYVAGGLAILAAVLTGVMTFVNPREKSVAHLNAGNKYNSLRNQARIFYEIEIENISIDKSIEKLNTLSDTRNDLNEKSPQVSRGSFEKARRGIEEGEAEYKADK